MRFSGHSRKRIARTLNAAYAAGLLSEDTYVRRIDELLSSAVIEPVRIAGDLNLRRAARAWHPDLSGTISRGLTRLRELAIGGEPEPETLLALDWTGATSELSIGRQPSCDVVFPELKVSRRHARLRFRDGRWILQDLASTNGTFVNGVRVGRCELRPGDHLCLGDRRLVID
jgi:FHA domain